MSDVWRRVSELADVGRPVVIVSVTATHGSASARVGSRLIIDDNGDCLEGWIGGGCIESLVRQESLAVLRERGAKTVEVDLNADELGYGMPCGGALSLYFDPVFPRPRLFLSGSEPPELETLASLLGYRVRRGEPEHLNPDDVLLEFSGEMAAINVDARLRALAILTNIIGSGRYGEEREGGYLHDLTVLPTVTLLPLGPGRITEHLIELAEFLGWTITSQPAETSGPLYAAISGQYKDDHLTLLSILSPRLDYAALVASRTRARLTLNYLREQGVSDTLMARIHSPAGAFKGAKNPQDIALGIVVEIIQHATSAAA